MHFLITSNACILHCAGKMIAQPSNLHEMTWNKTISSPNIPNIEYSKTQDQNTEQVIQIQRGTMITRFRHTIKINETTPVDRKSFYPEIYFSITQVEPTKIVWQICIWILPPSARRGTSSLYLSFSMHVSQRCSSHMPMHIHPDSNSLLWGDVKNWSSSWIA